MAWRFHLTLQKWYYVLSETIWNKNWGFKKENWPRISRNEWKKKKVTHRGCKGINAISFRGWSTQESVSLGRKPPHLGRVYKDLEPFQWTSTAFNLNHSVISLCLPESSSTPWWNLQTITSKNPSILALYLWVELDILVLTKP